MIITGILTHFGKYLKIPRSRCALDYFTMEDHSPGSLTETILFPMLV